MKGRELILEVTGQIQLYANQFQVSGDIKELRGMVAAWGRVKRYLKSKAGKAFSKQHPSDWLDELEGTINKSRQQIRLEELGDLEEAIDALQRWKVAELKMEGLSLSLIGLLDESKEKVAEVTGGVNLPQEFNQAKHEAEVMEAKFKRLRKVIPPAPQNQWTKEEKARVVHFSKHIEKEIGDPEVVRSLGAWLKVIIKEMTEICEANGVTVGAGH